MKILDAVISNVSGQSYGNYIRENIFLPLGMSRSSLGLDPSWSSEAAIRYDPENNPMRFYMTDHPGSGDVWASAHDTVRFAMFHLGTPLLGQSNILGRRKVLEMQQPVTTTPPLVGANWLLREINGHPIVSHGGDQPGVAANLDLYPDQNLAVVVLANADTSLSDISRAIAVAASPVLATAKAAPRSPAPEPISIPPGKWVGSVKTYQGEEPFLLELKFDGAIQVQIADQLPTALSRISFGDEALAGRFNGRMNTGDTQRHAHTLVLRVVRLGDELVGQLVAQADNEDVSYSLPAFVRLRLE